MSRSAYLFSLGLALLLPVLSSRTARAQSVVVWANSGEDKVTRDELRATTQGVSAPGIVNPVWDGNAIHLSGARNEVVAFNVIVEAPSGATNLSVSFAGLTGPGGSAISSRSTSGNGVFDFTGRPIQLFFVRYLQIRGVSQVSYDDYDQRHAPAKMGRPYTNGAFGGSGGWADRPNHDKFYPDIAVPLELVPTFSIPAASNQSVWADVYVPRATPSGFYAGQLIVRSGATVVKTIPVELEVYGFTLPELPASKTMIYLSAPNINRRYVGSAWVDPSSANGLVARRVRDNHFKLLHHHRLSGIGDDADCGLVANQPGSDRPCPEWEPRLTGSLFTPASGYDGPGVNVGNNVYSIATYGSWSWKDQGLSGMRQHTDAWETWFATNAPDTERFLYLIDESNDTSQIEQWSSWILNNPGPGGALRSLATIGLPTAALQAPSLDIAASSPWVGIPSEWEPRANAYTSGPRKRFYWYNGHRPGSGTFGTEDEGTALRELAWGQYKKRINRWFFWESTYYDNYQGGMGETNVFQRAQTFGTADHTDPSRGEAGWNYSNGDGVLFYPGTDHVYPSDSYAVEGPFASLRLKFWRRGIQDVDYLELAKAVNPSAVEDLVEAMVPKVLWEYGVTESSDPTYVLTPISWPSDPAVWDAARRELADIISGAPGTNPAVTLTSPTNGATVAGTATVSANASDSAGIAGVQFLIDGAPAGTEDTTAPYTIAFDTTTVANGNHSLAARARNVYNAISTSNPVIVTVANQGATPGSLSLVTPIAIAPHTPAIAQPATATFAVQNTGGQPVSVTYFVAAARTPSNTNVDFAPSPPVTLQPAQQYTYSASRTFSTTGSHTAWPAYYDGTNWIELAPAHTTFTVSDTPPAPPAITRLEETNAALTLGPTEWSWNGGDDPRASDEGYMASATADSTVTFSFTGTGVALIGIADSCSGQARIDIDGQWQTIDAYRPTTEWQANLFSIGGLPNTTHTFTLTVLGTNQPASCAPWIYIDAFDIIGTAGATTTRFEQDASAVALGPTEWSWNTGSDARASGGTYVTSSTAGSTLTFPFAGTGIALIGIADSCSGQATVDIDGSSETFDAYRASGGTWKETLFAREGLADGEHTVSVTVLGTKQAGSCGAWIYLDAFDVEP